MISANHKFLLCLTTSDNKELGPITISELGTLQIKEIDSMSENLTLSTISTLKINYAGTLGATFDADGLDLVSGDAYQIDGTSVLNATTLGSNVISSSLTSVGVLNSGSITSGFTSIDVGDGAITTTGTVTCGSLVGTL